MAEHWLPSHQLPDYLKVELGVGTPTPSPLLSALDKWLRQLNQGAVSEVMAIDPHFADYRRQCAWLAGFGFRSATLKPDEVARFVATSEQLHRRAGSLKAIEMLAAIYFGEVEIHLGLPTPRRQKQISRTGSRLSQGDLACRTIFVRALSGLPPERAAEFIHNAERLVPAGFEVQVGPALVKREQNPGRLVLKPGLRMQKGRL